MWSWWRSGGGDGGDSLFKGGSCNSCRSAIVKVAVGGVVVWGGCGGGGGCGGDGGGGGGGSGQDKSHNIHY